MSHVVAHLSPTYLPSSDAHDVFSPPVALGIDFGGTNAKAVLISDRGKVLREDTFGTPHDMSRLSERVLETVVAFEVSGLPVGVGVPVLTDETGTVIGAPNLRELIGFNVEDSLQARLGELTRPPAALVIENDSTCATFGEFHLGCAQGVDNWAMVVLGTGIGGGFVLNGTLVRGTNNMAGEIGHVIVDPTGPMCPCGRRGCWEMFASGDALARLGTQSLAKNPHSALAKFTRGPREVLAGENIVEAARLNDPLAGQVISEYARWVALGLANLCTALDLELVVIAGGPALSGDVLLDPVRAHFAELMQYYKTRPRITIAVSTFGHLTGAIGAAWLAYQSSLST